jgi:hypothetical protein
VHLNVMVLDRRLLTVPGQLHALLKLLLQPRVKRMILSLQLASLVRVNTLLQKLLPVALDRVWLALFKGRPHKSRVGMARSSVQSLLLSDLVVEPLVSIMNIPQVLLKRSNIEALAYEVVSAREITLAVFLLLSSALTLFHELSVQLINGWSGMCCSRSVEHRSHLVVVEAVQPVLVSCSFPPVLQPAALIGVLVFSIQNDLSTHKVGVEVAALFK